MNKILVKTQSKKYPIYTGNGIISTTAKIIKSRLPNTKKIAIISDKNLPPKLLMKLKLSLKR